MWKWPNDADVQIVYWNAKSNRWSDRLACKATTRTGFSKTAVFLACVSAVPYPSEVNTRHPHGAGSSFCHYLALINEHNVVEINRAQIEPATAKIS